MCRLQLTGRKSTISFVLPLFECGYKSYLEWIYDTDGDLPYLTWVGWWDHFSNCSRDTTQMATFLAPHGWDSGILFMNYSRDECSYLELHYMYNTFWVTRVTFPRLNQLCLLILLSVSCSLVLSCLDVQSRSIFPKPFVLKDCLSLSCLLTLIEFVSTTTAFLQRAACGFLASSWKIRKRFWVLTPGNEGMKDSKQVLIAPPARNNNFTLPWWC